MKLFSNTAAPRIIDGVAIILGQALQLADEAATAHILRSLQECGLTPDELTIELVESAAMDESSRALPYIHELHSKGIRFALDDFGSGYSWLNRLHELPINEIKIDGSFIRHIHHQEKFQTVMESLLELGAALSLDVIAEGVETEDQAVQLRRLGSPYAQGFHLRSPMSEQEATTYMENHYLRRSA